MILAGLSFGQASLVFGAGALLLVGFYLLKLRRRAVPVPFSPLWQRVLRDKQATSLFSQLKSLLSLLLQLVLLALLVVALSDPRPQAASTEGRNVVVLIDASASMQATDVSPTRLAQALDKVRALVGTLGASDHLLLAQMDAAITPLGPMSSDTKELTRALGAVRATDTRVDFPRAIRFARDALRGLPSPEIVVVSDGAFDASLTSDAGEETTTAGAKVSFIPVGARGRNVGITAFSVRRYPLDKARYEVMLEVTNTGPGPDPESVELTLLGDGQVVDVSRLALQPGERLPRFYANLSGARRTLEATLTLAGGGHDDLAADDHAYALLPERRRQRVLVVTPGNLYLDAALLLGEYLDVTRLTPEAYARTAQAALAKADVVIYDSVTPAEPPRVNALYLDPSGSGAPVKVGGDLARPGFDRIDRKHPIVRFTALSDVNIARAHKLVPGPGDRVVGAAEEGPILVAGERDGARFVVVGFDVGQSDLPLRVAWPVFLVNTLDWFSGEDAAYLSSVRTGDVWRIPLPVGAPAGSAPAASAMAATLTLPSGDRIKVPVHEGRAVYLGENTGFYRLAAGVETPGEEGAETSFAANLLDAEESRIAPVADLQVGAAHATPLEGFHAGARREVWLLLLLIAAALSALEWATYHRRVTV